MFKRTVTDKVLLKEAVLVHEPVKLTGKLMLTRTNTKTCTPRHFKFKSLNNKDKGINLFF